MSTKNLLEAEIAKEIAEIEKIEVGTESHKMAVDAATKLIDREIELKKLELEEEKAYETHCIERSRLEHDAIVAETEKRKGIGELVIEGAGIIIPAAIAVWGAVTSIKFEETGTITTTAGRAFIQRLFRK